MSNISDAFFGSLCVFGKEVILIPLSFYSFHVPNTPLPFP